MSRLLFLLPCFLLAGCVGAASRVPSVGVPLGAESRSMGQVLGLDGKPAAGVTVHAYAVDARPAGYRIQVDLATRTDAQGRFTLQAPASSTLNVEAVLAEDIRVIQMGVAADASAVRLNLAYAGSISGRVTAPDQAAVTDLQGVDVYIPGTSYLAKTDAAGHYAISNVAAGTFSLVASKTGLGEASQRDVNVRSRSNTVATDLGLSQTLPVFADMQPANAAVGQTVQLTGAHLGSSSGATLQVHFPGAMATQVTRLDDAHVEAVVPEGAGSGAVVPEVGGVLGAGVPFQLIASLALLPGNLILLPGATATFQVKASDEQGRAIAQPAVTWSLRGSAVTGASGSIAAAAVGDAVVEVACGPLAAHRAVHVLTRYPWVSTVPQEDPAWADMIPSEVLAEPSGSLLVADYFDNYIVRMDPVSGALTKIAGSGSEGEQDGVGAAASFDSIERMARDPVSGAVYVTESTGRIRRLDPDGTVGTLCGGANGYHDGPLAGAQFRDPRGVAVAPNGTIFVADGDNHCIRKLEGGQVSTLAGDGTEGFVDGTGGAARFSHPDGLVLDAQGNLLVADSFNRAIRLITPTGMVTTLAGTPTKSEAYFDGIGLEARFGLPGALGLDSQGRLYVGDLEGNNIRMLEPDGTVTTFAGNGTAGTSDGPAPKARFQYMGALAVDASGRVYVADSSAGNVRVISP